VTDSVESSYLCFDSSASIFHRRQQENLNNLNNLHSLLRIILSEMNNLKTILKRNQSLVVARGMLEGSFGEKAFQVIKKFGIEAARILVRLA
jgi:tetrahydrodipicolinate N-succinyltransferase